MNKYEVIARPYEEYYEMIKDMSKDNMIQGLYDLSKECIEKQNYINQLEQDKTAILLDGNTLINANGRLQQKVNQLEEENKQFQQANVEFVSQNNKLQHRIYEAIEYIKHSWRLRLDQVYDTSKDLQGWEVEELLSILERGEE